MYIYSCFYLVYKIYLEHIRTPRTYSVFRHPQHILWFSDIIWGGKRASSALARSATVPLSEAKNLFRLFEHVMGART